METERPVMQHDDAVSVHGGAAPILVQIDKGLGRQFFIVLWLSAFISALALSAVIIGGLVLLQAYRNQTAHVNTLQYDLANVKAQLIEKGLYEPTSH